MIIFAIALLATIIIGLAYQWGYSRGLFRSRKIEEQIDGPIVWAEIAKVRAETKGWMV